MTSPAASFLDFFVLEASEYVEQIDALILRAAARRGVELGLAVHAGHGLTVGNVAPVARIAPIEELNIGHSVVSRAIFVGLAAAVRELRDAMDAARASS